MTADFRLIPYVTFSTSQDVEVEISSSDELFLPITQSFKFKVRTMAVDFGGWEIIITRQGRIRVFDCRMYR
jgi:hypothetical protein